MHFRDVAEFEAILHGHYLAYDQLGHRLERSETFNSAFSEWLYRAKGATGASAGWAFSIGELASAQGRDATELFSEFVREFFPLWSTRESPGSRCQV